MMIHTLAAPLRGNTHVRINAIDRVPGSRIVVRFEEERRQFRNVEVWPQQSNGAADGVRYRFVWDSPFHISPHDNNRVYVASQHVHVTTNGTVVNERVARILEDRRARSHFHDRNFAAKATVHLTKLQTHIAAADYD